MSTSRLSFTSGRAKGRKRSGNASSQIDLGATQEESSGFGEQIVFEGQPFTNELWIKNKEVFHRPRGVDVEFVTQGAFDWVFADPYGTVVKTLHANEHAGWTSVDLPSLGLYHDYSIGFRNTSSGRLEIKSGEVRLSFSDSLLGSTLGDSFKSILSPLSDPSSFTDPFEDGNAYSNGKSIVSPASDPTNSSEPFQNSAPWSVSNPQH